MTLLEEIESKCPQLIAGQNCHHIADAVNVGRTKAIKFEIGNGTILETLGLTVGTAVLDAIHAAPQYKYVLPMLDQGRLDIGSDIAQAAVQGMVPALLTQEQADSLKNLGISPDPVTWQQVQDALLGV